MGRLHLGQYGEACILAQDSLRDAREIGQQDTIYSALFTMGAVSLAEGAYAQAQQLSEESVAVARETGRRDAYCWVLVLLAYAARALGNAALARSRISEALLLSTEIGGAVATWAAMPAAALLLADEGEHERSVEIYALASRYAFVANSRWIEDVAGKHIAQVAASLPPAVVAAAQERGRARDLQATAEELAAEFAR